MKKPIIVSLMLIPLVALSGCATKTNEDVNQYKILRNEAIENFDFHSELYVFPTEVNVANVVTFSYKTREDLFNGSYLFYLVMKYNQSQFDAELKRLDAVQADYEIREGVFRTKPIIKDDKNSQYVTISKDARYEYVKYNQESLEIAYVSNQLFSWRETGIKEEYIFDGITVPIELDDGGNSYNMYYYYEGDIGYYVAD